MRKSDSKEKRVTQKIFPLLFLLFFSSVDLCRPLSSIPHTYLHFDSPDTTHFYKYNFADRKKTSRQFQKWNLVHIYTRTFQCHTSCFDGDIVDTDTDSVMVPTRHSSTGMSYIFYRETIHSYMHLFQQVD